VTNAGGILAMVASFEGLDARGAFSLVDERVARNVKLVMETARTKDLSPVDAATQLARARLAQ
jgi:hypothetical protein